MPSLDLETVRHALKTAQEHAYSEVELDIDGASFRAKFEPHAKPRSKPVAQPAMEHVAIAPEPEAKVIKSQLVGFFRLGPSPMQVGARVERGEIVGVINALGIPNDLESQVAGEIVEVLVEDGQPVEFGQVLAKVK